MGARRVSLFHQCPSGMHRVLPTPNCFRRFPEVKPYIEEIVLSSESEETDEMQYPRVSLPVALPALTNPPNEPVFSSESELEFSEDALCGEDEHPRALCDHLSAVNALALALQRWAYIRPALLEPREIFLRIRVVNRDLRHISMAACPEAWLALIGHACHRPIGDAQAIEVYHALWNRADQAIGRARAKYEKSKRKLEEIESEFKRREREVTRARAKHRRLNRNRIPANNAPS